MYLVGVI